MQRLVSLNVIRSKILISSSHVICTKYELITRILDKNTTSWHMLRHTALIWKMMQDGIPWKIISHPGLWRISALSETNLIVVFRKYSELIFFEIRHEPNNHPHYPLTFLVHCMVIIFQSKYDFLLVPLESRSYLILLDEYIWFNITICS